MNTGNNLKNYPKVLVISHNPFCKIQNNGKTLTSIFSSWPSNKIHQLYFSSEEPDSEICFNYFKIDDRDQLKSLYKRKFIKGAPFNLKQTTDNFNPRSPSNFLKKFDLGKKSLFLILRDILWNFRGKTNPNLLNWVTDFNPDLIFFMAGNSVFSYEIAIELRDRLNIPVIPFFTDDYIMPDGSYNPIRYFHKKRVKDKFKNIVNSSQEMFVISDLMKDQYSSNFGGKYNLVTNLTNTSKIKNIIKKKRKDNDPLRLVYSGNLELGRNLQLETIADVIEDLSKDGLDIQLYVYSLSALSKSDQSKLNRPPYVRFMGPLHDNNEIINEIQNSDIVIHVESDKLKYKRITKYSVSTKISEYMSNSKCILAFGPKDVASMVYLSKNKSAILCHDKKDLLENLNKVYKDLDIKIQYERNALKTFNLMKETIFVEDIIIESIN